MTTEEFNKLKVNDTVFLCSNKRRKQLTAAGAAYRINRTTKQIKPFGCKRWYSYKSVTKNRPKDATHCLWGICGPTHIIEMQATESDIARL